MLSAYARSRNDIQVRMLPIVTKFYGEAFDDPQEESVATSHVFPFTAAHVDILLKKNVVQAQKEVQWLDGLSEIPFYTWDTKASLETWKEDHPNGSGYVGNEADSQREDSIYLSYAILFLPQTPNDPHDMAVDRLMFFGVWTSLFGIIGTKLGFRTLKFSKTYVQKGSAFSSTFGQ